MEAVKRAYAEIMLNTAKESAARILAAERRAAGLVGALAAAKDDAVAALVRLKSIMNAKIKEVEMQSLAHVEKINELKVQLNDAQSTTNFLQIELQKVNGELVQTQKSVIEENKNTCATCQRNNDNQSYSSDSKICLPFEPDSSTKQRSADEPCSFIANSKENGYLEILENPYACNPDLSSLIMRRKEPELCWNGCTQRIRALEQNSLNANTILRQIDEQSVENEIIKKPCAKCSTVEDVIQVSNLTMSKQRRGRRGRSLNSCKPDPYNDQGEIDYRSPGSSGTDGCLLLIQALEEHLSPTSLSPKQGRKQFVDLKDNLLTDRNLSGQKEKVLQGRDVQRLTKGRSKPWNNGELGASNWTTLDSERTGSSKTHENCYIYEKEGPVLLKCTTGAITQVRATEQSQLDLEDNIPAGLEGTASNIEDEGNLTHEDAEGKTQDDVTADNIVAENKDYEVCTLDFNKVDATIASFGPMDEDAIEPRGVSVQTEGAKFKYTFNRRKRKSASSGSNIETVVPEKKRNVRTTNNKQELQVKLEKPILLSESPRSSRRIVQAAHKLVSLSGKRL